MASIAVPISGVAGDRRRSFHSARLSRQIGAWLIVLFLICVTPMMHNFWAVADPMMHQMQIVMFMKNFRCLAGR